jgi:membrane-bound lytic murein transglycosylase A
LHSLAVDKNYIPLGVPLWVDIEGGFIQKRAIRNLMVAQDTGNAIKGRIRGDFFWGYGTNARKNAEKMRNQGQYFILLPRKAAERLIRRARN